MKKNKLRKYGFNDRFTKYKKMLKEVRRLMERRKEYGSRMKKRGRR